MVAPRTAGTVQRNGIVIVGLVRLVAPPALRAVDTHLTLRPSALTGIVYRTPVPMTVLPRYQV